MRQVSVGRMLLRGGAIPAVLSILFVLGACSGPERVIGGSGTIEGTAVTVSSQVTGELLEVAVSEGDRVEEGELLARIDYEALSLQLEQAEAGRELADAQLRLLLEGARSEDIRQAEAALTQAEENLKRAREDYRRMQKLFESRSIPQKQLDDAEARLTIAQASYDAAMQGLRKLENLARPQEVRAARSRVVQADAGVRLLERQIADATVRAPVSGIVTHRLVERGELARQGQGLFVVTILDTVTLTVYVPEPDLGRIRVGQPARVFIDSYPERPFPGRVLFIAEEAEFTPKQIQTKEERVKTMYGVKVELENPDRILKAGMPADAELDPIEPPELSGERTDGTGD